MTSMIEFQIRRRLELQAYAKGDALSQYGFRPDPPAVATHTAGKGTRGNVGHLNLTTPMSKVGIAITPRQK